MKTRHVVLISLAVALAFIINDLSGVVTCYEAQTGSVVWQGRLGGDPAFVEVRARRGSAG
jgi:hypothetical protein